MNEYCTVFFLMLEHSESLEATETLRAIEIVQYPTLVPQAKTKVVRHYNQIVNGRDSLDDAIIKIERDRERLRTLFNKSNGRR